MGFNLRKMEANRKARADKEAAIRRETDAQVLEDAERLIGARNERQARRMPLLFAPTMTSLTPSLSCRSCRPNAPFAELIRLSRTSIADEMRIEHTPRILGE
jgi:hypothetical protein